MHCSSILCRFLNSWERAASIPAVLMSSQGRFLIVAFWQVCEEQLRHQSFLQALKKFSVFCCVFFLLPPIEVHHFCFVWNKCPQNLKYFSTFKRVEVPLLKLQVGFSWEGSLLASFMFLCKKLWVQELYKLHGISGYALCCVVQYLLSLSLYCASQLILEGSDSF